MIRPSRTREIPFIIQTKITQITAAGDSINTFVDSDKIWMSVNPLNSREILTLGGQLNEYWFKCSTKFNARLTHTNRLRTTENPPKYYSIESVVDPVGDRMTQILNIKITTPNESGAI